MRYADPWHGRLAQRESASFTPRRSLVRSQYRPPGHRPFATRARPSLIFVPLSTHLPVAEIAADRGAWPERELAFAIEPDRGRDDRVDVMLRLLAFVLPLGVDS